MFIQKERIVVNNQLQNVQGEINAKKNTWLQWYAQANAFDNKVSFKSYAEVLEHGKQIKVDQNDHTFVQQAVSKVPITWFFT